MVGDSSPGIPDWALYTGQGVAALAAGWLAVLRVWPRIREAWRKARASRQAAEVLENARVLRYVGGIIREWVAKKGAQRALLLHARNNGKPWPAHHPVYVSCIDQAVPASEPNTWERWQDWRIDPSYRAFLHDVLSSMDRDRGVLLVTEMMERCVLRDAYEEQGTVASIVFGIRWLVRENALIYASLNFGRFPRQRPDSVSPEDWERTLTAEKETYEQHARELFAKPDRIRAMIQAARNAWRTID